MLHSIIASRKNTTDQSLKTTVSVPTRHKLLLRKFVLLTILFSSKKKTSSSCGKVLIIMTSPSQLLVDSHNIDHDLNDPLLCNDISNQNSNLKVTSSNNDSNHFDHLELTNHQQQLEDLNNQQLLQSFTKLQIELEQTKSKQVRMTNDNKKLLDEKKQFEIKITHLEARLDETKKSLMQHIDSTVLSAACKKRVEEVHRVEMEWRRLVDKERKEIEECKEQYLEQIRDVDKMRYRIRQEIQKEYDDQITTLSKEVSCFIR